MLRSKHPITMFGDEPLFQSLHTPHGPHRPPDPTPTVDCAYRVLNDRSASVGSAPRWLQVLFFYTAPSAMLGMFAGAMCYTGRFLHDALVFLGITVAGLLLVKVVTAAWGHAETPRIKPGERVLAFTLYCLSGLAIWGLGVLFHWLLVRS